LLATLKLQPLLPYSVGVSSFPSVQNAANAVAELVKSGVGLQCIELLDDIMMKAVNLAASGNPGQRQYAENPSLFLKFSGTEKHIEHDIKLTCQSCMFLLQSAELTWTEKQPKSSNATRAATRSLPPARRRRRICGMDARWPCGAPWNSSQVGCVGALGQFRWF
jgi:hypothetical protein